MTGPTVRSVAAPPFWARRFRLLVRVLLTIFFVASALIALFDHVDARGDLIASEFNRLTATSSAYGFEAIVQAASSPPHHPGQHPELDQNSIWPLRTSMLVDSLVLEPAYGGLLVLFLMAFRSATRRETPEDWDVPLHAVCLLLAAGVMFDLAENGMAVRAAEDGLHHLLAQSTVDDVHLATRLKWSGIGAASFCVGLFGLGFARRTASRTDVTVGWLRLGSWSAIAMAPFVALQLAAAQTTDGVAGELLRGMPGLAFALALTGMWMGLRRFDPGAAAPASSRNEIADSPDRSAAKRE